MKKNLAFVLFSFLVLIGDADAQSKRLATRRIILEQVQGYSMEALSGCGITSAIISNPANPGSMFPAAMLDLDHLSAGGAFQLQSTIIDPIGAGITCYRAVPALPQALGLVWPLKNFALGLAFQQKYNIGKDYGRMTGTLVDPSSPGGFRDYIEFNAYAETVVANFAIALAAPLPKCNALQVGIRVNAYRLSDKLAAKDVRYLSEVAEPYQPPSFQHHDTRPGLALGLNYQLNPLSLQLLYDTGANFVAGHSQGSVPGKICGGILLKNLAFLTIGAEFHYVLWEQRKYQTRTVANSPDYALSAVSHLAPTWTLSAGFYRSHFRYKYSANSDHPALFLAVGLVYALKNLKLELAVADSHLGSDDERKQTIGKFGISIGINQTMPK